VSYNVTQTLVKGATTLTIPFPEAPGYTCTPRRGQSVQTTWGGALRVADRNTEWFETAFAVVMERDNAGNTDIVALEAFMQDTIKHSLYSFTWTDIRGTAHSSARLIESPTIEPISGNLARVSLKIRTSEMVFN